MFNVNAGNITLEEDAGGTGTTTTDTTDDWADGETHTLEVRVDLEGAATYLIDGSAPTLTKAFSFTAADVLIPFFYFLNGASTFAGEIILQEWEWGFLGNAA